MNRQAVVFIHGVGDQLSGYSHKSADLIDNYAIKLIRKELKNSGMEQTGIEYREVWWAPVTSRVQKVLWKRINKSHNLDWTKLRRFIIDFAGDAIAYQKQEEESGVYEEIHKKVTEVFDLIAEEFPDDQIEYTIIAHSLGTVIASNYLYDHRKELTATNFFTLGSPLAIWLLSEGDVSKANQPVKVSRPNGVWINILDDEDIIACPLRDVNAHYRKAVDKDIVREVGGALHRGPVSHLGYWSDDDVTRPIARKLAMDYLRIHADRPYRSAAFIKSLDQIWSW